MLRAQNLSLAVAGRGLINDLSVELAAGENWMILGANGSGKTTLLHAFAGLRPPRAGYISLDGEQIGRIPARRRARRVGVLFQDTPSEFPATVMETVLTGRHPWLDRWQWESSDDYRKAEAALAAVGLAGLEQRSLATLSGGERRRAEIASLLVQDAPVCLLDEPITHLDLHHQARLMELLADRARRPDHLNVFVLHDINLAARFGSHGILLFDNGECRHGRLREILTRPNLERLYHCGLREIRDGGNCWYLPA